MTCDHCCNRRLPQLLPAYVWLCNHCGAYVDKAGNPVTVTQTQADTIGTVPLADPGPDCATRRADAARDRAAAEPATIARARQLAADYQANPTPARAHNAAQVLWDVLGTLDAVVARTFAITDENDRLTRLIDEARKLDLLPPSLPLATGGTVDQAQTGQLCDFAEGAGIGFTDADKPTPQQIADLVAKHLPHIPAPLCFADGPQLGANTLTCFLTQGHQGDHSTNAFPNPRTWPPLATGGIVNPNATHRIGEDIGEKRAFLRTVADKNRAALDGLGDD